MNTHGTQESPFTPNWIKIPITIWQDNSGEAVRNYVIFSSLLDHILYFATARFYLDDYY